MHELDDWLEHSGVKGMKWGVRRDDHKSVKRKPTKQEVENRIEDVLRLVTLSPRRSMRGLTTKEQKVVDATRLALLEPKERRQPSTATQKKIEEALKKTLTIAYIHQ